MFRRTRFLLPILLCGCLAACGGAPIPAKTIVLTFDDGVDNHLSVVAPVLEKHGFGATFFVTGIWAETTGHLTFDEMAELDRRGFEIASHSYSHWGFHPPDAKEHLPKNLRMLENELVNAGMPKPVSFAWPGGAFGPEGRQVLLDRGYLFGRRVIHPEFPPGPTKHGLVYDPAQHDPLLIPTWGLVNDSWDLPFFASVVSKATTGKAVVLCFHGVPDAKNAALSTSPEVFEAMMEHLAREGYRGIAMRDLEEWVDPDDRPPDPLVHQRCPKLP